MPSHDGGTRNAAYSHIKLYHRMLLIKWKEEINTMTLLLYAALRSETRDFTLDPATRDIWVLEAPGGPLAAFRAHSRGGRPVYLYGTTHNDRGIGYTLKLGYAKLLEAGKPAYVGRWVNKRGKTFIDSATVMEDVTDDAGALAVLGRHGQESAVKLELVLVNNISDVEYRFINVGDQ